MRYRIGYYRKDGTYVQGHYVNRPARRVGKRRTKKGCLGLIMIVMLLIAMSCEDSFDCGSNCSDFSSQATAQAAFDANRSCLANLDRDNDGIACEN